MFQCSCLKNPRDGGAWWAAVYGVAQSRTRLSDSAAAAGSPRGGPCCSSLCHSLCFSASGLSQFYKTTSPFTSPGLCPCSFLWLDCLHFLPCDPDQVSPPSEIYPWFPKSLSHLESQSPSPSCTHPSPEMARWLHLEFPWYLVGLLKVVKGFVKFSHIPCWDNKRKIDVHGQWNKI